MVKKVIVESTGSDTLRPGGGSAGPGDLKMHTISGIVSKLSSMSKDDVNGFLASLAQIGHEADDIPGGAAASNKSSIAAKSSAASVKQVVKEDLASIFGDSETPLSEEFINKATTLFEAAITTRVNAELISMREEFEEQLETATETVVTEMAERLDKYIDYVAENWMEENRLEVESGVRAELAESFIKGMANVFAEHYIEIPDEQVDLVGELANEIAGAKETINSLHAKLVEADEYTNNLERHIAIGELTEGMASSDAEALTLVLEDVDAGDVDSFLSKGKILKEQYGGVVAKSGEGLMLEQSPLEVVTEANNIKGPMAAYAASLKLHTK